MIGQTVSHYKILEKLGEGGMGVVYKALDTNLDRTVALKFMPHHLAPDETEEARFLQEAKAASALNHPNVCTIYGIHDEDGQKFIEMEFVEGVTLRQRLPIQSLAESITYGVQIADALFEAHQKGIVHRDIKADNIMINAKNQIKVMDFGLAKLKGTLRLTKASSTVGTLAYMAPEQIQGGDVDARSDIFSYGVVLYEMLTGKLPFHTEHEAALMYSIINDDPDPIQKYRNDLSPVLTNLIQRALEKDPNDRFQSINEMVIELRRLQKQSTKVSRASLSAMPAQSVPFEPAPPSNALIRAAEPKKSKRTLLIGGGGALLLIGVAVWIFVLRPSTRFDLNPNMSFRTLQIPFQEVGTPSLSRDGGWVAFPAIGDRKTWDVYLMNSGSGEPRQITNDSSGFMASADLSPDGGQIVYDRADKAFTKPEIAIVSSLGGFSKRIVNVGFYPKWRPDGQRIAYVQDRSWGSASGKTEFRSVRPNGTDDRLEFADSLYTTDLYAWAPDGKAICWTRRDSVGHFEITMRDLESGKQRQLISLKKSASFLFWTQNDQIVFTSDLNGNDNLWIMPSSGGTPVQITRGSGPDIAPTVSADLKRLLYMQRQPVAHVWIASLQQGGPQQVTFDDAELADPMFSPDGRRVLYVMASQNPSQSAASLFVIGSDGKGKTQLMSEEGHLHSPAWSPDGKWIVYAAHRDTIPHDSAKTYIVDAENPGSPRQVGVGLPRTWLNERSFITWNSAGSWICTIDGAPPKKFFRDSTNAEPVLDGEYVLYTNVIPTRGPGIWLDIAPGSAKPRSEPRQLIKSLAYHWYVPTLKSVYYQTAQGELRRLRLPDGEDQRVEGSLPGFTIQSLFKISSDGQRIAYLDTRNVSKLMLIDNFH
jgi:eukaryotic-like serine/threonine-protein kinase